MWLSLYPFSRWRHSLISRYNLSWAFFFFCWFRKYPTLGNVEKKKEEEAKRKASGQVLKTKNFRYMLIILFPGISMKMPIFLLWKHFALDPHPHPTALEIPIKLHNFLWKVTFWDPLPSPPPTLEFSVILFVEVLGIFGDHSISLI